MKKPDIRILLIGEYSIFRNALRMLIESRKNLRVIGEAAEIEKIEELIKTQRPDLILLDLPEVERPELYTFLQKTSTTIPTLVLSGRHDPAIYQRCLRIGIGGMALKEVSSETLFKAIEKVYEGELWYDRSVMGATIRQLVDERNAPAEKNNGHSALTLSDRERQVVDLICKGLKNKSIAEELSITETTVRHHLTSIFAKLEVTSRLELVIYAFRHNLATVEGLAKDGLNGFAMPRGQF